MATSDDDTAGIVESAIEANRVFWEASAVAHAGSPDYALARYAADPGHLSEVVRFDRERLGDISGLDAVHLQCHIGTDTVSLARLGARMTGLDFSPASIDAARALARAAGVDVTFVTSDVRDAVAALEPARFDLVYTGVGALCWVPDIAAWARIVATLLRPGGRLFVREGHPVLWALDDTRDDEQLVLRYPYVETSEPLAFEDTGTYVRTEIDLGTRTSHSWNHGIGEIITAALDAGLVLTGFVEHDTVPWNALAPGVMVEGADGEWRLAEHPERAPLSYTLQAVKPLA